jgi:hypothetical protein
MIIGDDMAEGFDCFKKLSPNFPWGPNGNSEELSLEKSYPVGDSILGPPIMDEY